MLVHPKSSLMINIGRVQRCLGLPVCFLGSVHAQRCSAALWLLLASSDAAGAGSLLAGLLVSASAEIFPLASTILKSLPQKIPTLISSNKPLQANQGCFYHMNR